MSFRRGTLHELYELRITTHGAIQRHYVCRSNAGAQLQKVTMQIGDAIFQFAALDFGLSHLHVRRGDFDDRGLPHSIGEQLVRDHADTSTDVQQCSILLASGLKRVEKNPGDAPWAFPPVAEEILSGV